MEARERDYHHEKNAGSVAAASGKTAGYPRAIRPRDLIFMLGTIAAGREEPAPIPATL